MLGRLERIVLVKDCGHMMMLENPLGTAKKILKYYLKWCCRDGRDIGFSQGKMTGSIFHQSHLTQTQHVADADVEKLAGMANAPDLFGVMKKKKGLGSNDSPEPPALHPTKLGFFKRKFNDWTGRWTPAQWQQLQEAEAVKALDKHTRDYIKKTQNLNKKCELYNDTNQSLISEIDELLKFIKVL
jgi:hypothetical protein